MDVINLMERELLRRSYSLKTIKTYSYCLNRFLNFVNKDIKKITKEDIKDLVKYAKEHGESITMRAAGTDMTGGPLSESIVVDVTKHMNKIGEIEGETITVTGTLIHDTLFGYYIKVS